MRRVAADAGVTVGLVVHHFGTKERLREEVETYVVDRFGAAIRSVPVRGSAGDVARGRDEAVATMLATEPDLVTYLRRALLGLSGPDDHLLRRLTELAAEEVARAGGGWRGRHRPARVHADHPDHDPPARAAAAPADDRRDVGAARGPEREPGQARARRAGRVDLPPIGDTRRGRGRITRPRPLRHHRVTTPSRCSAAWRRRSAARRRASTSRCAARSHRRASGSRRR
uniref:TetR/AcrR family transcriptional regulator helix-turn-helix transcriptional regulator n=1 Tax=Janibacter limosus TaxID=53458 RepID=A0AC61U8S1_9MICO